MKQKKSISSRLDPSRWVRGDWRARHNLTDADIAEMLKPENIRVNISIKLPLDVLDFFRAKAERTGTRYQTQINQILRAYVDEQSAAGAGNPSELKAATRSAKSALNRLLETLKDSEAAPTAPRPKRRRQA